MSLITSLSDAITRMENAPSSYNNPGAIMDLEYYRNTGEFRLQTYGSYEEGRNALERLVQLYINEGHNLYSFFAKYAPQGHGNNNPRQYAETVSGWIGVDPNVRLSDVQLTTEQNTGTEILRNVQQAGNEAYTFVVNSVPAFKDIPKMWLAVGVGALLFLILSSNSRGGRWVSGRHIVYD